MTSQNIAYWIMKEVGPVQKTSKRLGAIIASAVLLVALVFGGVAVAEVGSWWDSSGNKLTVVMPEQTVDNKELLGDVAGANVVVDVIKIGTATPNADYEAFDYAWTDDFASLNDLSVYQERTRPVDAGEDWTWSKDLATDASKLAKLTEDGNMQLDQPTDLEDGLYLVMAHGKGVTDITDAGSSIAYSSTYQYSFQPVVLALPTKAADANGVIRTDANYGPWLTDVTVALKPEQEPLYGSLRIVKTVTNFAGEPATFVFHIVGKTPTGDDYDNYASVFYDGGESKETIVDHIPAGTVLTVTEEYTGARFTAVSGDNSEKTIVADSAVTDDNPMASAAFTNKSDGSGKNGHGIENNFKLTQTGESDSAWDWVWKPVPEEDVQEPSN